MKVIIIILLGLVSCAHHQDVRPGDKGIHSVSFFIENKNDNSAYSLGKSQAEHFCKEYQKSYAVINEKISYVGDMDESSYNQTKKISKAVQIVGGTIFAAGGKKESDLAGIAGLGGAATDSVTGKGYKYEMTFKCQGI